MSYLDEVIEVYNAGKATEHSYRPALKNYLEELLDGITATNEPKRQKCGAPDYIVTRHNKGSNVDIGYIEAKDIGIDLDKVEFGEQFTRYKTSLDNLILTDYIDFRFFIMGEKVAEIAIGKLEKGKITPLTANIAQLEALLHEFAIYQGQTIHSASILAEMMGKKAGLMREVFSKALAQEEKNGLQEQLYAFRQILVHDMEAEEFADVYSQTIAYGLFTARLHDDTLDTFSRREALDLIPTSNPFLQKLFQFVALELDDSVAWIVDGLCEVFRATNIRDILADFGKQSGRDDPMVHFYETFLAVYNADLRKSRGVWFTPEPVVGFIIRAIDDALKTYFELPMGIADNSKVKIKTEVIDNKAKKGLSVVEKEVHKVQLLDVATGTGTFISEVIKHIYHSYFETQQGMWSNYVEEHLLPRLHGFEILMASYAMCHLKIDLLLKELNYKPSNPKKQPRLGVYLTNSLEEAHPDAETLFASWLANEANAANAIKRDMPVMVAMGNPPYNVSTQNKNPWIDGLIADYKKDLNEKNINPLSDDYVKFIRYAEHFVEKTGYGIIGYISNNSFLDGVIHRQMRKHLLETFDVIYIYDLHGSAKKKETAADGSQDQNVFDIQQGVSISICIKYKPTVPHKPLADLYHASLQGKRQTKFQALLSGSLKKTGFKKLKYSEPYYFFVPKDFSGKRKYNKGFKVNELFQVKAGGIKTERDDLVIKFRENILLKTKEDLMLLSTDDFRKKHNQRKDGRDWTIASAKSDLLRKTSQIIDIIYRPFDKRKTLYTGKTKGIHAYPRHDVMQHFVNRDNLGLLTSRNFPSNQDFNRVFITKTIADIHSASDQTYCFPLYLYSDNPDFLTSRTPNLDIKIVKEISKKLSLKFMPDHELSPCHSREGGNLKEAEKIDSRLRGNDRGGSENDKTTRESFTPLNLLDYIYAILHCPTYRTEYQEFLKIDFPTIPYPEDAHNFWQLVALGKEIRLLHLMESPKLAKLITSYPISGNNKVEIVEYKDGKVYINKTQFFDGVPLPAWEFYIGGYQPAQKWLKDRKGEILNYEDINHYQQTIGALLETSKLMEQIDEIYHVPD